MKKSSLVLAAAITVFAAAASAQTASTTTTTTTWSDDQGPQLTQYWTTNKYAPVVVPNMQPAVGAELPSTVMFYPLPTTFQIPDRDRYSYSVINSRPVVVERSTRRVVHVW
jgi:hypothetical protein